MRTALKEVNEMEPTGFSFSIGRGLLTQHRERKKIKGKCTR